MVNIVHLKTNLFIFGTKLKLMKFVLQTFSVILLLSVLTACKSSTKMLEGGDYDSAINLAISRLAGKKKKSAKEVAALEDAFDKATTRDMNRINALKSEGRRENWERIYDLAQGIERRQARIEPLLPLVDERGKKADFRFVRVSPILQEARVNATEYLYELGSDFLKRAKEGDKPAAREAYHQLSKIDRFFNNYKDKDQLMQEARDLGVSHILFRMENAANVIIPRDFEQEILRMSVQDLNELWREYHMRNTGNLRFDYEIVMSLQGIELTPERVREREYQETAEIKDGERNLLDDKGKEVKDSTGKVIKVPIIKVVQANILEVYQTKSALVSGTLFFYDKRRNSLMDSQPIAAEAIFEHYSSTFQGDRRALSDESRRRIGNRPIPFPSNEALVLDAANVLKPIIKQKMERANFF